MLDLGVGKPGIFGARQVEAELGAGGARMRLTGSLAEQATQRAPFPSVPFDQTKTQVLGAEQEPSR